MVNFTPTRWERVRCSWGMVIHETGLEKIRFCKDYYYEMDDHTLKYHVLTIWKFSSREQSGWGYIQSYGGLKNATRKKNTLNFAASGKVP